MNSTDRETSVIDRLTRDVARAVIDRADPPEICFWAEILGRLPMHAKHVLAMYLLSKPEDKAR